jgi:hypothetical protein
MDNVTPITWSLIFDDYQPEIIAEHKGVPCLSDDDVLLGFRVL